MKTLQKNFTTQEQSKRLLELGVPADSADCYYDIYNGRINVIHTTDASWRETDKAFMYYQSYLPCWSVGRLIEIELLCREKRAGRIARLYFLAEKDPMDASTIGCTNIVDGLISYMESAFYKYDFSKLED